MSQKNNKIYDMPNKESMRRSHYGESWDMKIYNQGNSNYKIISNYIDRCLSISIGKNIDTVKKHMYEKMSRHNKARYDKNLIETLIPNYIGEDRYCKYTLDIQNRVQLNKLYIDNQKKYREDRLKLKTTIIDNNKEKKYRIREDITDSEIEILKDKLIKNGSYSKDVFNHIVHGGILSGSKYKEFIEGINRDGLKKDRWGYNVEVYDTKEYAKSCFSLYEDNIAYVFDGKSSEFRRYKKERLDRIHKKERESDKLKKEYNDSLLYSIEYSRKKKEEAKDIIDRDRLGFDDDSFKGEEYHGQKRKKKDKS